MTGIRLIKNKKVARISFLCSMLLLAGCSTSQHTNGDNINSNIEISKPKITLHENIEGRAPIMLRIFKEEGVLEVWKRRADGRFAQVGTYKICTWSGKLGPKYAEGDRQAPEGFYNVGPGQLNPNSEYHLSFNIGFPNTFDRVNGRYGTHIMVHGDCSSAGCYSMDNKNIEEIYEYARQAFQSGQKSFQIQAYPFRMTQENMTRYRDDSNFGFWLNLKQGYDVFERTRIPPKVDVCEKRYVFNQMSVAADPSGPCPDAASPLTTADFESSHFSGFAPFQISDSKASPTIQGIEEAAIVADWSKRRARGEQVSRMPPNLNDVSATQVQVALTPVLRASAAMMSRAAHIERKRMPSMNIAPKQRRF